MNKLNKYMIIGLNAKNLLITRPAGPEKYTLNLYKSLLKIKSGHSFIFYSPKELPVEIKNLFLSLNSSIKFRVIKPVISWTHINLFLDLLFHKVNVFFTPEHTLPSFTYLFTPVVVMIHGLEYKTNKQLQKGTLRHYLYLLIINWACKHSKYIVVPSSYVKSSLIGDTAINIDEKKIKIIHEGIDTMFLGTHDAGTTANIDVLKKYNLNYKFILFVSTIQPRKNIPALIRAFSMLIKNNSGLSDTDLVLVGKDGWNTKEIYEAPKMYGVVNNVKFLGWVPDSDLRELFIKAKAYANFSFDEGFGLTLLEAMASKIPCAVSDIPAYKEVGLNFCVYADPYSPESMTNALENVLTNPNTENIDEAYKRAIGFSWDDTAKVTLELLENTTLLS